MTKTITIKKASEELPAIIKRTKKSRSRYFITVDGVLSAVLMSHDEYEKLEFEMETNEILADKELMKAIKEGEEDIKAGRVHDWEDVKKELGIDVQNKGSYTSKKKISKNLQKLTNLKSLRLWKI